MIVCNVIALHSFRNIVDFVLVKLPDSELYGVFRILNYVGAQALSLAHHKPSLRKQSCCVARLAA